MRGKRIGYIAIGVFLVAAVIFTGSYGLSERNQLIYKNVMGLENQIGSAGFEGFRLSDYPVSFYDGNYDYVLTMKNNVPEIKKRKPVLSTYVGTAYPVADHYEILMPTVEKFSEMFAALGTMENLSTVNTESNLNFEETEYGDKEQEATVWHEGFHAYQMTHFKKSIDRILGNHSFGEGGFDSALIVSEVDENDEVVNLYKQELSILKEALQSEDIDEIHALIVDYKELEDERKALLTEPVLTLEEYYERVEGTARYIEGIAYQELYSQKKFRARYIDHLDTYSAGADKYYAIGMAKCMVLDKLDGGWKTGYNFSVSLSELLELL